MTDGYVDFKDVRKEYHGFIALHRVSLSIRQGEFFSLLGPSGCGKTTTLRILAGFVSPTSGEVTIGGRDITSVAPEKRNVGLVFQDYAVFPHMSVFDNVAFGLQIRRLPKHEIERKVHAALGQVGLSEHETAYRRHLSGGQQQRVALARALVTEPDVLLLDEPLSALDLKLREEMRYWVRALQHRLGITTIYVTHDQSEALTMSDRIAVMNGGHVMQVGSPAELYERPADRFVATFLGSSTTLSVRLEPQPDGTGVICAGQRLATLPDDHIPPDTDTLLVRPEQIEVSAPDYVAEPTEVTFRGIVTSTSYEGSVVRYQIGDPQGNATVEVERANRLGAALIAVGDRVAAHWPLHASQFLAGD